jgi:predicted RNA binding protein YcfA (HicA-like mRNA interferase family)
VSEATLSPLNRRLIIEMHIGYLAEIQRNAVEHSRIDDRTRTTGSLGSRRHEHTAFAAQHELRGFLCEAVVPNLCSITNLEFDLTRRVRGSHYTMAPTEGTAVVPQRPVRGFDFRTINDLEKSAMATASIFLHGGATAGEPAK